MNTQLKSCLRTFVENEIKVHRVTAKGLLDVSDFRMSNEAREVVFTLAEFHNARARDAEEILEGMG